jgi:hypothetical protein
MTPAPATTSTMPIPRNGVRADDLDQLLYRAKSGQ